MSKNLIHPSESVRARAIAFYLPQFHPIPENDAWWEKGFTEWTNVTKARPLFRGHHQPDLPSDLGFYDLRVPEVREAQADLARAHGIEGFCYWHYWFGQKRRILERVFDEVLASGRPDFPFCLAWANQTWSGVWHGLHDRILMEQTYPGEADYRAHFDFLLRAFRDPRYIRIDGKPLFVVYRPRELPNSREVIALWKKMAMDSGLPGLVVAGISHDELPMEVLGYDLLIPCYPTVLRYLQPAPLSLAARVKRKVNQILGRKAPGPTLMSYRKQLELLRALPKRPQHWAECVMPNWDTTPRSGTRGLVFPDACPELYRLALRDAIASVSDRPSESRLVFIKSWNEWAEGNYLEPSRRFGLQYLQVTKEELERAASNLSPP